MSTKKLNKLSDSAFGEIERAASLAKCLSNGKRLAIVLALGQTERTVGELATYLGIASQVISVELRIMKQVGAVASRRQHPEVYYRLSNNNLAAAGKLVMEQAAKTKASSKR